MACTVHKKDYLLICSCIQLNSGYVRVQFSACISINTNPTPTSKIYKFNGHYSKIHYLHSRVKGMGLF
jgi:hypothetical protein